MPVLGRGHCGDTLFITGHKQTQLNQVCYFLSFGEFLASKISVNSKLIPIALIVHSLHISHFFLFQFLELALFFHEKLLNSKHLIKRT